MNQPLEPEPPPIRIGEDGAVRVGPTRVTLAVVIGLFLQGMSPEELVEDFPTLGLADVYGTIAYYLRTARRSMPSCASKSGELMNSSR
jgi:uncharacterized protein (DUF433 family)